MECVVRARAGFSTAVLVEGEAGIGKSRLVAELLAAFREPKDLVAVGHGVELAGGELPYGTAAGALRALVRDAGVDVVRNAAAAYLSDLSTLCLQLGDAAAVTDRTRLLTAYVATLDALAADRLVCLVVEDLHWTDISSRDLFTYLVRVAGPGHLLVVFTVRTHDAAVDPAVADLVSDLAALPGVDRISLTPLSDAEVAALVSDLASSDPEPAEVSRIVALAQGSPLLTGQLVAAGLDSTNKVPGSVLAPLSTKVRRLDQPARRLVQLAALTDGPIPQRLLMQAHRLAGDQASAGSFETAIEDALTAGLLRFDRAEHHYSFTHALLREAVESTISPHDRLRGHRLWAELMSEPRNHGGDPFVQIAAAHHWAESGDDTHAFDAALRAARIAGRLGAWPEAGRLLRRALGLYVRVPDAADRSGLTRDRVLADAIMFLLRGGRSEEMRALIEDEIRRSADSTDHERSLTLQLIKTAHTHFHELHEPGPDDRSKADAELLLGATGSPLLPMGLIPLGWTLRASHPDLSFRLHRRALEVVMSERMDNRVIAATTHVCAHLAERGRFDEALGLLHTLDSEGRDSYELATLDAEIGELHCRQGRFRDAARFFERAISQVPNPALQPNGWCASALGLTDVQLGLGDWADAERWLARIADLPTVFTDLQMWQFANSVTLACGRGRLEGAGRLAEQARSLVSVPPEELHWWPRTLLLGSATELATTAGRPFEARDAAGPVLAMLLVDNPVSEAWPVVLTAARAEGDLADARTVSATDRDRAAVALVRDAAERMLRAGAYNEARYTQTTADLLRAEGHTDASIWLEVVEAWRRIEHVPHLGWALHRYANAANTEGDKGAATDALSEAWEIAITLGAEPLRASVIDLTRRAHLKLDTRDTAPARPQSRSRLARLTDRELEVLRHVAQGETNDELASALFISPKTASVHVSRILTKLDVTSRAKATAVAYEEGLFDEER
jgi:DNA-binding CsgD family transcriptional regulator/tetratricopeptide (TPR) repeat protein